MRRKVELLEREDAGWAELCATIARFDADEFELPGLTEEGWSVKDACWHIGCWCAEAVDVLEQIRMGTYEDRPLDIEALNREWFEVSRKLDAKTVRVELAAARNRMLEELHALPDVSPEAMEWFEESGPLHYREHAGDLARWADALTGRGPSPAGSARS
jgi:hypothetical protein